MKLLDCLELYLQKYAKERPDRVAVVSKGEEYTFSTLWKYVLSYSKHLIDSGLKRGDVVIVKARQSFDYVVAYLSIHLAGGVVASLEKSCPVLAIESIAKQLGATMIIDDDVENDQFIVLKYSDMMGIAKQENIYEPVFPKASDVADILFTTGTTGKSKGVEITHHTLVVTGDTTVKGVLYKEDNVVISPGPLNHAGAIRKVITSVFNGSTVIILDGLKNIDEFYKALNYPCRQVGCCLVPAFVRIIFQNSETELGKYADKIEYVETGSAPFPEADKERLCKLLPHSRLYNLYGSSESAFNSGYDYNAHKDLKNCIGKAPPNVQVVVVDKDKNIIKNSSKENPGYIAIKGDVNMKGYKNEPELTKEVLINGMVVTQDLGYINDEGYIFLLGRDSDVINVGGLKIAPAEVESVILGMEGVKDCIIIEDQNGLIGKSIKLLYVADQEIEVSKFVRYLRRYVENYKIPTSYEKVDAVKRQYNGKLDRKFYKNNGIKS